MKKTIIIPFILLIMLLLCHTAEAKEKKQKKPDSGKKPPFGIGTKTLALSIGVGYDYGYDYYYGNAPTVYPGIGVIYDQGIIKAGPGIIGVGGIIDAQFAHYSYPDGDAAAYKNYVIAVRGTYHLTLLKDKNNKFDPYGGATFGFRIFSYADGYYNYSYHNTSPVVGLFVGARYNFQKHIGVFAEVGYDISLLRFGVNFNF